MSVNTPPAAAPATALSPGRSTPPPALSPGLEGVVLSTTRLSRVDGERGRLTLAGYPIEEIAPRATFEEAAYLLRHDRLPTADELGELRAALADRRSLPRTTLDVLRAAAADDLPPMRALTLAAATFALGGGRSAPGALGFDDAELTLLARMPRAVGTYARLRDGQPPITSAGAGGVAEDLLFTLTGAGPAAGAVRALDTYLVTVADHGANASTFTARVILSTGAGTLESVLGALGALAGPLHGGAPGPALDLVREIGEPGRSESVLRTKLDAGERLMGFGHRVYKVRDPRAEVLSRAARLLYEDPSSGADRSLYALTRHVEDEAVRLLDEYKPGRRLRANVELYTALLLDGLGLGGDLFTAVFAVGRTAGWLAHGHEQRTDGKLIRPRLHYAGAEGRTWDR
ncbi:MAG: citrate/2-methylcitrate synthase [Acidobacteriota bacterium]